jgi:hypothetical protein
VVRAIESILEGDEAGQGALIDTIVEGPFGATVPASLPVVEPLAQDADEVDAEAGWEVSSLIGQAELPRGLDQKGEAVFAVVVVEIQVGTAKDVDTDGLDIIEFVQSQLGVQHQAEHYGWG